MPNNSAAKFPSSYQDPSLSGHSNDVNHQILNYENESINQFNPNYNNTHDGNEINQYKHMNNINNVNNPYEFNYPQNHQNQYYNHSIPQNSYMNNMADLGNHYTLLQADKNTSIEYSEPSNIDYNYNRTDNDSIKYDEHNADSSHMAANENYNHENDNHKSNHILTNNHNYKKVHNNGNSDGNIAYSYNRNEVKSYVRIYLYNIYLYMLKYSMFECTNDLSIRVHIFISMCTFCVCK